MNIVVLLSAGRHPVSGLDCPVPVELQAIALGLGLGRVMGLHAGPGEGEGVAACLGHGLPALTGLDLPAESDPLPALVTALTGMAPDLVLAGRRGQGGDDTGLLPYRVVAALGWPILADAIAITAQAGPGVVTVEQALPRGARRRVAVPVPALVTIHPAAPPALAFAEGRRRRGVWTRRDGGALAGVAAAPVEERPYRRRPRLIGEAAAAASRLVADPAPTEAADEILAFLRGIGMG
jgi:electron transfer flavoprotein beta subunit